MTNGKKMKPGRKPGSRSVTEDAQMIGRSITLPRSMWAMLDAEASREKITRSLLIRRMAQYYLNKKGEAAEKKEE